MRAILRQPFSVLGAIGLLGLAGDLIHWREDFAVWIDAWKSFSRPIAIFLFGWLVERLPWALPTWWADYLVAGLIVNGAAVRAVSALYRSSARSVFVRVIHGLASFSVTYVLSFPFLGLTWPLTVLCFVLYSVNPPHIRIGEFYPSEVREIGRIFLESFVWAAAAVGLNYALIHLG